MGRDAGWSGKESLIHIYDGDAGRRNPGRRENIRSSVAEIRVTVALIFEIASIFVRRMLLWNVPSVRQSGQDETNNCILDGV